MSVRHLFFSGSAIIVVLLAFIFFILSNRNFFVQPPELEISQGIVNIEGFEVAVEIARSRQARAQGLSGRNFLSEEAGMLFVYDQPGVYSFWMKDMKFPVDIVWIGADKKIVDITYDARPESYPEHFSSRSQAQYVLEVNNGWAERHGIEVGDKTQFRF